jgi:hypothetical protein
VSEDSVTIGSTTVGDDVRVLGIVKDLRKQAWNRIVVVLYDGTGYVDVVLPHRPLLWHKFVFREYRPVEAHGWITLRRGRRGMIGATIEPLRPDLPTRMFRGDRRVPARKRDGWLTSFISSLIGVFVIALVAGSGPVGALGLGVLGGWMVTHSVVPVGKFFWKSVTGSPW